MTGLIENICRSLELGFHEYETIYTDETVFKAIINSSLDNIKKNNTSDRNIDIIKQRIGWYGDIKSRKDISDELEITTARVYQLERNTLDQFKFRTSIALRKNSEMYKELSILRGDQGEKVRDDYINEKNAVIVKDDTFDKKLTLECITNQAKRAYESLASLNDTEIEFENKSIEDLEMSLRTYKSLKKRGIMDYKGLLALDETKKNSFPKTTANDIEKLIEFNGKIAAERVLKNRYNNGIRRLSIEINSLVGSDVNLYDPVTRQNELQSHFDKIVETYKD